MSANRLQVVRDYYSAYQADDRRVVEELLSDDFRFSSPADVGLDRAGYFERCWPNAGRIACVEFERLLRHGDDVVVTYEATRVGGQRFRNTEIFTFDGDSICRQEVYFGWNLD